MLREWSCKIIVDSFGTGGRGRIGPACCSAHAATGRCTTAPRVCVQRAVICYYARYIQNIFSASSWLNLFGRCVEINFGYSRFCYLILDAYSIGTIQQVCLLI